MIYQTIRALAEWMEDPDTGPNHYLPDVERESDDAQLDVPLIKVVLHPFRDAAAFGNTEPGRYPALIVSPAGAAGTEGEVNVGELNGDEFPVQLRLVVAEIKTPKALRVLAYQGEAINRAVSGFFADSDAASAARQRRGVQMITCAGRSYGLAFEDIGTAKCGFILLITVTTRDTEAS